jgi:hypothetical protein
VAWRRRLGKMRKRCQPERAQRHATMKVLIIGLNHQIQADIVRSMGPDIEQLEREQKDKFTQTIHRVIQQEKAQFVGEEGEHGVPLIAERVAQQLGCKHANVEMAPAERRQRGIPPDYSDLNRPYSQEQRDGWNTKREQYIVQSAIFGAGTSDKVIILCGRDHTDSLATRFRELAHDVETYDLNQEGWYVEDWLKYIFEH